VEWERSRQEQGGKMCLAPVFRLLRWSGSKIPGQECQVAAILHSGRDLIEESYSERNLKVWATYERGPFLFIFFICHPGLHNIL
jgi:hypothetical protein